MWSKKNQSDNRPTGKPAGRARNRLNIFQRRLGFFRTIAIVIDNSSIQLATGQRFGHLSRLIDVTKIYIPTFQNNEEIKRNFIISEINKYIQKYERPYTRFILGVSGPETIFRTIRLPKMPRREIGKAVLWEGNKRIPFDLNKACYGYRLNNSPAAGDKNILASLIAVSRAEIDRLFGILEPLDFKVDTVYLEQEAIGYLLPYIDGFEEDKTYALINIKKGNTEISYYSGTSLEFTHSSSVGAELLTTRGIGGKTYEQFTQTLLTEIQNSLDYYAGQFSRTFNDRILVYGDFSYSDELISKFSNNFGLEFMRFPVERWTKSWIIKQELLNNIPPALGVVALAMADYDLINFLPNEIKENRRISRFYKLATPAMIAAAVVMIGYWASLKYKNDIESYQLQMTQNQIEQFKSSGSFRLYNQIRQQIALDQAFVDKMKNSPTFLHLNLKELSRITPEQIKLDIYNLKSSSNKPELFLSGRTISNDPPPEIILAEFVAQLENSPFFDKIEIKQYSKQHQNGSFVLDFQIEMEAII